MKRPLIDMTKGATPYLQRFVVPLESGAIYLCHVMAGNPPDGEAAAMRAAADQGNAPAWDTPAAVPGPSAGQAAAPGIELLRGPDATADDFPRPAADPGPDMPARFVSFEFQFCGEWSGHCAPLDPAAPLPDPAPRLTFWTVYGRGPDGLAMAIGDFSSRGAARAVALAIAEGRPVTDETGETVLPDGPPYDRETVLEAGACLWESVLMFRAENRGGKAGRVADDIDDSFAVNGSSAVRAAIVSPDTVEKLESGYRAAVAEGFDSCFDWQFCPAFVADCLDWQTGAGGLPMVKPDFMETCRAIGREELPPARFVSVYFAQGEEAARDLDNIEEHGAESFLDTLAGAVDLTEGEATAAPPWGAHDTLRHAKGIPGGILYLHSCPGGNYVSVTFKRES